jgi:hypothetical protein
MTPDEIAAAYPFYALDDIVLGSINTKDEGLLGWRRGVRLVPPRGASGAWNTSPTKSSRSPDRAGSTA